MDKRSWQLTLSTTASTMEATESLEDVKPSKGLEDYVSSQGPTPNAWTRPLPLEDRANDAGSDSLP